MNGEQEARLRKMLKAARPALGAQEPAGDLWPAMQRRLRSKPNAPSWFDWALAGGLAVFIATFPGAIPLLLYYL
jgi:hypothetical protein